MSTKPYILPARVRRLMEWLKCENTAPAARCEHGKWKQKDHEGKNRQTSAGVCCEKHYMELQDCQAEGCLKPAALKGFCRDHLSPEFTREYEEAVLTINYKHDPDPVITTQRVFNIVTGL